MQPVRKGATKRCCYGVCKSDTRYKSFKTETYYFINFPKPCLPYRKKMIKTSDKVHIQTCSKCKKCDLWVKKCGRNDRRFRSIDNVTKDTYICSLHFYGESGPTEEYPDPLTYQEFQKIDKMVKTRTSLFEKYKNVDMEEANGPSTSNNETSTLMGHEEIQNIGNDNFCFNSQVPFEFFIFRDEYF
ncbi:uncharacterized protein LOC123302404 [Chrysoperla carnea]|uniref:uncharacterized protein LOC123302404 n=1 Tax=Chrysoperla carnea TaxID=189513 RepID=UPI001D0814B6|nr:uncharacterized protein LOC123302404 [Chrysoperla carnea]